MRRTIIAGLFGCCFLLLQGQSSMGQATKPETVQKPAALQQPVVKWETVQVGVKASAQVLKVWQYGIPDDDHRIALIIVSGDDFQRFVNDPDKFIVFLNENHVFWREEPVREVAHWASVLRASKRQCCMPQRQGLKSGSPSTAGEDPDPWLITAVHGRPCRVTVTSQPLEPPPPQQ
jgi:hypothetical protein